jgi:hypothetical protein
MRCRSSIPFKVFRYGDNFKIKNTASISIGIIFYKINPSGALPQTRETITLRQRTAQQSALYRVLLDKKKDESFVPHANIKGLCD